MKNIHKGQASMHTYTKSILHVIAMAILSVVAGFLATLLVSAFRNPENAIGSSAVCGVTAALIYLGVAPKLRKSRLGAICLLVGAFFGGLCGWQVFAWIH